MRAQIIIGREIVETSSVFPIIASIIRAVRLTSRAFCSWRLVAARCPVSRTIEPGDGSMLRRGAAFFEARTLGRREDSAGGHAVCHCLGCDLYDADIWIPCEFLNECGQRGDSARGS